MGLRHILGQLIVRLLQQASDALQSYLFIWQPYVTIASFFVVMLTTPRSCLQQ